jgi:hypothetical protein
LKPGGLKAFRSCADGAHESKRARLPQSFPRRNDIKVTKVRLTSASLEYCLICRPTEFGGKQLTQKYPDCLLEQTHGDKVRAAKILDVDLSTLYRWEHAKN